MAQILIFSQIGVPNFFLVLYGSVIQKRLINIVLDYWRIIDTLATKYTSVECLKKMHETTFFIISSKAKKKSLPFLNNVNNFRIELRDHAHHLPAAACLTQCLSLFLSNPVSSMFVAFQIIRDTFCHFFSPPWDNLLWKIAFQVDFNCKKRIGKKAPRDFDYSQDVHKTGKNRE